MKNLRQKLGESPSLFRKLNTEMEKIHYLDARLPFSTSRILTLLFPPFFSHSLSSFRVNLNSKNNSSERVTHLTGTLQCNVTVRLDGIFWNKFLISTLVHSFKLIKFLTFFLLLLLFSLIAILLSSVIQNKKKLKTGGLC